METITCQECGTVCEKRGPTQKFCRVCSARRDLQRKKLWSRGHPPSTIKKRQWRTRSKKRTEQSREAGLTENAKHRRSSFWYEDSLGDLIWMLRVMVPFTYATSKNHIYARRRSGHVYLRSESLAKRTEISLAIREGLSDRKVAHNKVWIDILVQKPNHYGDAINVIDLVCDAIKDALPVDDRWFCIRCVDWEIVKHEPQLIIGIGQRTKEDAQVCSYCGQIKPLDAFNRDRGRPLGVGRECRECRRAGRLLKHQATASGSTT